MPELNLVLTKAESFVAKSAVKGSPINNCVEGKMVALDNEGNIKYFLTRLTDYAVKDPDRSKTTFDLYNQVMDMWTEMRGELEEIEKRRQQQYDPAPNLKGKSKDERAEIMRQHREKDPLSYDRNGKRLTSYKVKNPTYKGGGSQHGNGKPKRYGGAKHKFRKPAMR